MRGEIANLPALPRMLSYVAQDANSYPVDLG